MFSHWTCEKHIYCAFISAKSGKFFHLILCCPLKLKKYIQYDYVSKCCIEKYTIYLNDSNRKYNVLEITISSYIMYLIGNKLLAISSQERFCSFREIANLKLMYFRKKNAGTLCHVSVIIYIFYKFIMYFSNNKIVYIA